MTATITSGIFNIANLSGGCMVVLNTNDAVLNTIVNVLHASQFIYLELATVGD